MTLTPKQLVEKWTRLLAETRADLEARAAAGDERALKLLETVDGKRVNPRVDVPIPGPPPHWQDDTHHEPGEEG